MKSSSSELAARGDDLAGTANDQTLPFTYNAAGQIGLLA